ncbi:MAG: primosome assembly protein PriA, partial [Actinomycetota bacterium]|nr:primosome assembly protein PriA [Actinomycetota bacterium]
MNEPASATQRHEQLALTREQLRRSRPREAPGPAARRPVARVLVDLGLAHLDRPFDYRVNDDLAADAQPGCRVKVRFAGKDVAGYLLERVDASDHQGRLAPLRRVVSPLPVLTPQVARLCREVADRYAGVVSDVLRLAVPPRHARVEREVTDAPSGAAPARQGPPAETARMSTAWARYPAGAAYLDRLHRGLAPRAVWTALPGPEWVDALADAVL